MSEIFPIVEDPRFRRWTAAAAQTVFSIPFVFQDNNDLVFRKIDGSTGAVTLLTAPANLTISGAGNPSGGSFTLISGAIENDIYEVEGRANLARGTTVTSGGKYKSRPLDDEIDRNRIVENELRRDVDRAWKSDFGTPGGLIEDIPAGNFVKVDANGNFVAGGDGNDIAAAQANAEIATAKAEIATTKAGEAVAAADAAAASVALLTPTVFTKSADYLLVPADANKVFEFTGKYTATLTSATTLGNGWNAEILGRGGPVTIVPDGAETIEGGTSLTIADGESVRIICTGTTFKVLRSTNGWLSFEQSGAIGDDDTDDTAALAALLAVGGKITGKPGAVYKISATLNLVAGTVLDLRGCRIKPTSALTGPAILATAQDNIEVYWGELEGTGEAFSDGNQNLVVFDGCDNFKSHNGVFRKSRNGGLWLKNCTNSVVMNPLALSNYGLSFHDRDGLTNHWHNPISIDSGTTGFAQPDYSGGRGILVWRGYDITIHGGYTKGSSEYGVRVYSEVADVAGSSFVKVIGHHCEDNAGIDYYVYNESGSITDISFSECTVLRNVDPTSNCIAFQGDRVSWDGGGITKIGVRMAVSAISLYGLNKSSITRLKGENLGQLFGWSPSVLCDDILLDGIVADVSTVGAPFGTKITYRNSKFKHGGVGATDVAIDAGSGCSPIIDNCEFDGFWRNVSWVAQAMTLRGNTSRNTSDVSLRMNGDGGPNLCISANDFDTGSNPGWVATAYRQKNSNSRMTIYNSAAPTTLTWARGDRAIQPNPTVALPKSWVCTVSGAPGTWVSEGNL